MWFFKCLFTINGHLQQYFLCQYERFTVLPSVGVSMRAPYIWLLHNRLLFAGCLAEIHTELTSGWVEGLKTLAAFISLLLLLLRRGRGIVSEACKSPSPPLSVFSVLWHNRRSGATHPQQEEQSRLESCQRILEGNKRLKCSASEVSKEFLSVSFAEETLASGASPRELMDPVYDMEYAPPQVRSRDLINNSLVQQSRHALKEQLLICIVSKFTSANGHCKDLQDHLRSHYLCTLYLPSCRLWATRQFNCQKQFYVIAADILTGPWRGSSLTYVCF